MELYAKFEEYVNRCKTRKMKWIRNQNIICTFVLCV